MTLFARIFSAVLVAAGLALFSWILWDATDVSNTLGLGRLVDEATVAVVGLAIAAGSFGTGLALWRRRTEGAVKIPVG